VVGLSLSIIGFCANAQEVSVVKEMYGVELGIIKSDVFYEFKLNRKLALRTELAVDLGTYSYKNWENKNISARLIPLSLVVEPRFYYGIDRRNRLGKNINFNSSNYYSLKTAFSANRNPIYKTDDDILIVNSTIVAPSFGIRRGFTKKFSYEFAFGYGLQYNIFSNEKKCNCNHLGDYLDIQAKIGYNF